MPDCPMSRSLQVSDTLYAAATERGPTAVARLAADRSDNVYYKVSRG